MNEPQKSKTDATPEPGFAPEDYTDNRALGDWLVLIAMFLVWLGLPQKQLSLSDHMSLTFSRYAMAGLSGVFGGVLFAMKWLYHSVAKQLWNLDRRLWRYFAPVISGGLAFATISIAQSFGVFAPRMVATSARTTALGFLVGFFSDNALAKLAEVAQTLFGPTHRKAESPKRT